MLLGKDGKTTFPTVGRVVRPQGGGSQIEYGSTHQISLWLDKGSGDVMRKSLLQTTILQFQQRYGVTVVTGYNYTTIPTGTKPFYNPETLYMYDVP